MKIKSFLLMMACLMNSYVHGGDGVRWINIANNIGQRAVIKFLLKQYNLLDRASDDFNLGARFRVTVGRKTFDMIVPAGEDCFTLVVDKKGTINLQPNSSGQATREA